MILLPSSFEKARILAKWRGWDLDAGQGQSLSRWPTRSRHSL